MSDSFVTHGLQSARLLCPWYSPGRNTGVGCHYLLWAPISSFRFLWPRNRTRVSCVFCIGWWILYHRATWEAPFCIILYSKLHKSITTCRVCTHVTMYARCELTYIVGHANAHLHLWRFATWMSIYREHNIFSVDSYDPYSSTIHYFDYCTFVVSFEGWKWELSNFVKIVLDIWVSWNSIWILGCVFLSWGLW